LAMCCFVLTLPFSAEQQQLIVLQRSTLHSRKPATCLKLRKCALAAKRDCQDDDNSPDDQLLANVKAH
jgi:hypothetical protein